MRLSILLMHLFSSLGSTVYVIQDNYAADSFASMFSFWQASDPTNGYVNYIGLEEAESTGLYNVTDGVVRIGVDSTNIATGSGRNSVRIQSTAVYNHGLFILDLAHMPAGACGTWPAFWMYGPNWPSSGELDIIEGVNSGTTDSFAMHTSAGCSISNDGNYTGTLITPNCDVNAAGQGTNVGCSIHTSNTLTYGAGFNNNGGGVYATEWTSQAVNIWFFPRGSIPADITAGTPNPSNWGLPMAQFAGACDLDESFVNQQIVFDVTFCGDWAGNVWSSDPVCSPQASSCQAFVQNNPSAFTNTYWAINALQVYQDNGAAASQTPTVVTVSAFASPAIVTNTVSVSFTTTTSVASISSTSTAISINMSSASSVSSISTTSTSPTSTISTSSISTPTTDSLSASSTSTTSSILTSLTSTAISFSTPSMSTTSGTSSTQTTSWLMVTVTADPVIVTYVVPNPDAAPSTILSTIITATPASPLSPMLTNSQSQVAFNVGFANTNPSPSNTIAYDSTVSVFVTDYYYVTMTSGIPIPPTTTDITSTIMMTSTEWVTVTWDAYSPAATAQAQAQYPPPPGQGSCPPGYRCWKE